MLLESEIKIGGLYSWDLNVTDPDLGCNLFTIIDKKHDGLIVVESLDGHVVRTNGTHCMVPAKGRYLA
jgi:hypothetical protein